MKDNHVLAAVLSSVFSSISIIFYSVAVRELNPFIAAAALYMLGGAFFLLYLFARRKLDLKNAKRNKKDIAVVSFLRTSAGPLMLAVGLSLTQSIKVIFFTKIEPYFVLVLGWVRKKERVRRRHVLLLAVHLLGAFLLSTSGNIISIGKAQAGDLLVIAAVVLFALSYNYSARLAKNMGAIQTNGFTSLLGGLVLLPIAILFQPGRFYSLIGWVNLLIAFMLFNILALTLWFYSLKKVKGWIVSALRATGPLAAAPLAFLLLGEALSPVQILGAALVLATSFLISREHK